jgi:hypothetical protein
VSHDRLRSTAILGTFAAGSIPMKKLDAAERKVLIVTTFVSACIALAPQEWVSAGVLLAASGLLFAYDRRVIAREKAAAAPSITAAMEPAMPAINVASPPAEPASIAADPAPRAESAAPPPAI